METIDPRVLDLVDQLAQAMGTTTDMVWAALLHQAPISATATLILLLFLWVALIFGTRSIFKHWTTIAENAMEFGAILAVFTGGFVTLVLTLGEGLNMLAGFFNPNYWALRHILGLIQ